MGSQHTPAPWHVPMFHGRPQDIEQQRSLGLTPVPALMNDGARIIMTDRPDSSDTKRIALVDCQTPYKRGQGHNTSCAERDANARLIAAAPEMLAALKEAYTHIFDSGSDVTMAPVIELIGRAIAKAEGK